MKVSFIVEGMTGGTVMYLVQKNHAEPYEARLTEAQPSARREKEKSGVFVAVLLTFVVWAIGFVWCKTSFIVGLGLCIAFLFGLRAIPTGWFGAEPTTNE